MIIGLAIGAALGLGVGGLFFAQPLVGLVFGIVVGVGIGVALNYGGATRGGVDPDEPLSVPGLPDLPDRSDEGLADAGITELIDEGDEEPVRPLRRPAG